LLLIGLYTPHLLDFDIYDIFTYLKVIIIYLDFYIPFKHPIINIL